MDSVLKNFLFVLFCSEVKIPCRIVKGFVKGSGYRLGEKIKSTNEYCIVYLDNAWRFVDPHWGSQYVIADVDNNNEWEVMSNDAPPTGRRGTISDTGNHYEMGNHCDDFYFLTDPVAMVYTHLTSDKQSQVKSTTFLSTCVFVMVYISHSGYSLIFVQKESIYPIESWKQSFSCFLRLPVDTNLMLSGPIVFDLGLSTGAFAWPQR